MRRLVTLVLHVRIFIDRRALPSELFVGESLRRLTIQIFDSDWTTLD